MEKQQIYETIIQNLPIGFSIVDKKGTTVDFNEAAEKITGYKKKKLLVIVTLKFFMARLIKMRALSLNIQYTYMNL